MHKHNDQQVPDATIPAVIFFSLRSLCGFKSVRRNPLSCCKASGWSKPCLIFVHSPVPPAQSYPCFLMPSFFILSYTCQPIRTTGEELSWPDELLPNATRISQNSEVMPPHVESSSSDDDGQTTRLFHRRRSVHKLLGRRKGAMLLVSIFWKVVMYQQHSRCWCLNRFQSDHWISSLALQLRTSCYGGTKTYPQGSSQGQHWSGSCSTWLITT